MSLGGRKAVQSDRFDIVLRHALAGPVGMTEVELRGGVSLGGRRTVLSDRLGSVLQDALAVREHHAEGELRHGEPLEGRPTEPHHRLGVIRPDTLTLEVRRAELELCVGVPLLSRQPVPPSRLGIVLWDFRAERIHDPEVDLRLRIPLLSQCAHLVERLLRLEGCVGNQRTDADQDGGQGEDACLVNRNASLSSSYDDDRTIGRSVFYPSVPSRRVGPRRRDSVRQRRSINARA